MRNTIVIALIAFIFIGCKKDRFTTKPQLKFESVNTQVLDRGQILSFKLSYTDLEGDLQDSIYVEKVEPTCPQSGFSNIYRLPNFPTTRNAEGEIQVSFGYNVNNYPLIKAPQCGRNDTCYFRFVLKDKAQNLSDTVKSDVFVIIK
jgi:hypothetical protein